MVHPILGLEWPTNRTILELKQEKLTEIERELLDYQSHHTGIETAEGWFSFCLVFHYQSHHTGIETGARSGEMEFKRTYQSHHTGIETPLHSPGDPEIRSTNRTILELKHRCYYRRCCWIRLPIAPYWNWNQVRQRVAIEWFTTNRTILELKLIFINGSRLTFLLPIAPYWNWNHGRNWRWAVGPYLPIAPYWNWNNYINEQLEVRWRLPIAPYWNWNMRKRLLPLLRPNYQSHHTGIETLIREWLALAYPPTNRTILELKRKQPSTLQTKWNRYQSHHTGIETPVVHPILGLEWPTNRTILELKQEKLTEIERELLDYQSHHTGIETAEGWFSFCLVFHYQSHHTGIETGARSGEMEFKRTYQSHHTGIETPLHSPGDPEIRSTNRTILELKHRCYYRRCCWIRSTNRTILELKQAIPSNNFRSHNTTNRTILELKPGTLPEACGASCYQSHHTGIETYSMRHYLLISF